MSATTMDASIVGHWYKVSHSACSAHYPDLLSFQPDFLYQGQAAEAGEFTIWDVGTYTIDSPQQIRLSTANDAIVSYRFSLGDGVLQFTDPEGCEIRYHQDD